MYWRGEQKPGLRKPFDPTIKLHPAELIGGCVHEAGHAAVFWYTGNSFHEDNDLTLVSTPHKCGTNYFRMHDGFSPEIIKQLVSSAPETAIVQGEEGLQILLGGPLAERRYMGRPKPIRAIRKGVRNPDADEYKVREYVIALHGKDDHRYQIQLQNQVWTVLTEPRMWSAIEKTAWKLYKRRHLSGSEIEEIFEKADAPIQWAM